MTVTSADVLLNDQEVNLLADLFLGRFGFDKRTLSYRLLRNSVILLSHGAWKADEAYSLVAAAADVTPEQVKSELDRAISSLKAPLHETFNAYYAPPPISGEVRGANVRMPEFGRTDDKLGFLGTVFMYLVLTNYNKYEYIDYRPSK